MDTLQEISGIASLEQLDVAHNFLSGCIPESICEHPNIQCFGEKERKREREREREIKQYANPLTYYGKINKNIGETLP